MCTWNYDSKERKEKKMIFNVPFYLAEANINLSIFTYLGIMKREDVLEITGPWLINRLPFILPLIRMIVVDVIAFPWLYCSYY
jgi:hypothetical protein